MRELLPKTNGLFFFFSDGASGHFKNNLNMLNLVNHKIDISIWMLAGHSLQQDMAKELVTVSGPY